MNSEYNKKKVVITGGAGFIGSHAVDVFLKHGYQVTVIDNLRTGDLKNIEHVKNNITFIHSDIQDKDVLRAHIDDDTSVVHLAALISVPESIEKPTEAHTINVTGTEHVLSVSVEQKAKSFVSASSAAVYGNNPNMPIKEDSYTDPISPYGLHKLVNEQYGKLYSSLYKIPTVFLRFFNVYGPRQKSEGGYASVIPIFLRKLLSNETPTMNGDGSTTRDFVFVTDVAQALYKATEYARSASTYSLSDSQKEENRKSGTNSDSETVHEVINIGTGIQVSLNELWNTMCRVYGTNITPLYAQKRIGDIDVSYADVNKAQKILDFKAEVGIEEGVRELIEYSRK